MPDLERGDRPLSPFMLGQYYRFQLTSVTSILNRITGNALLLGALLLVWWFLAASISAEYFALVDGLITSWFGDLVMFLSLWALWYHMLGGIRHLIWDSGSLLGLKSSYRMGYAMIVGSVVLTILTVVAI